MKIAIASENKTVSEHFGHCEDFITYAIEDGKSLNKNVIANPGHRPGYLPVFLKNLNVDVIISGGMGETAQQLFKENGIEVVVGAQGFCDDAVQQYIKGELKSTGSICKEHEQEGYCND